MRPEEIDRHAPGGAIGNHFDIDAIGIVTQGLAETVRGNIEIDRQFAGNIPEDFLQLVRTISLSSPPK